MQFSQQHLHTDFDITLVCLHIVTQMCFHFHFTSGVTHDHWFVLLLGFSLSLKKKSTTKILVNWKANNNIFESQTNIYLSSHCLSAHVQTCSTLLLCPHRAHRAQHPTRDTAVLAQSSHLVETLGRFIRWDLGFGDVLPFHRNAVEHSMIIIILHPIDVYGICFYRFRRGADITAPHMDDKLFAKCLPSTKSIIWKLLLLLLLLTPTTHETILESEWNRKEIDARKIRENTEIAYYVSAEQKN